MSITLSGSSVTFSGSGQAMTTASSANPHQINDGTAGTRVGSIGIFFNSYSSYITANSTISGSYLWYPLWYLAGYSTTGRGQLFTQGADAGGGVSGDPAYPRTVVYSGYNVTYAYAQDTGDVALRNPGGYVGNMSGTWKALVGVPPSFKLYSSGPNLTTHYYISGLFVRVA